MSSFLLPVVPWPWGGGGPHRVPLEKDNSEEFRQRELRAAQLAREIESSPQYRLRIAMENDDGRTEEEKHSAVQRQGSGRESPSLAARWLLGAAGAGGAQCLGWELGVRFCWRLPAI